MTIDRALLVGLLGEILADADMKPSPRLVGRLADRILGQLPPVASAPAPAVDAAAREASWFQTNSNLAFFLIDPDPELVSIDDISHSLSLQCRFNGHVPNFYSVAQHSELVARCVMERLNWDYRTHGQREGDDERRDAVRWGLLHDAAETYVGDVIRPLKKLLPEFLRFEEPVERAIATRFELPWPMPPIVKIADRAVLAAERKWLRPKLPRPIASDEEVEPWPSTRFCAYPPDIAGRSFLDLYRRLYKIGEH